MVNLDDGNLKGKVGFIFVGLALVAIFKGYIYVPEVNEYTFNEFDTIFQFPLASTQE